MRYGFLFLFLILNVSAKAQALRDINYNFLYSTLEKFSFDMKAIRSEGNWVAYYKLKPRDTSSTVNDYWIQWEIRNTLADKEGKIIKADSTPKNVATVGLQGKLIVPQTPEVQILVAKVVNNKLKRAWLFYRILEPNTPLNGYLTWTEDFVFTPYIKLDALAAIHSDNPSMIVSYYNDDFPAGSPPFSETLGKVNRGMKVDSTFTYSNGAEITLSKPGLYLVQKDTNAVEGFAFRVADDYPRFSKVQSLADPLIYICTKQEFDRVKAAKGDKKAFDKVILSITGDASRAKQLVRSYFRRVELANTYFTSYKEGWKTDRGMIFTIFGVPDEVYKFNDREVWNYDNPKATFNFAKSPSLFDPDNYVLVREKKFTETWYEMIDLWRNARI